MPKPSAPRFDQFNSFGSHFQNSQPLLESRSAPETIVYSNNQPKTTQMSYDIRQGTITSTAEARATERNEYNRQQNSQAVHQSGSQNSGTIIAVEVKSFCKCEKSNCIKGQCQCYKAKRACTVLCHGNKGNPNCNATENYYKR